MADIDNPPGRRFAADGNTAERKVAIEHEPAAAAGPTGDQDVVRQRVHRQRRLDVDESVFASRQARRAVASAPADDIDGAAKRVSPMRGRSGPGQHFDAIDGDRRQRDLAVVVAALRIVDPEAIDQNQEPALADQEIQCLVG